MSKIRVNNISKIDRRNRNILFCKIATIILSIVLICMSFNLFLNQYYEPKEYTSDLSKHIKFGKEGNNLYSLMYVILGFLSSWPNPGFFIAIVLTFFVVFSVWATKKLLSFFCPDTDKWILWVYALICNMSFPIQITLTENHSVRGYMTSNVYHNSTYLAMKPLAFLVIYYFFTLKDKYVEKPLKIKQWFIFTGLMLITTAFKPNFIIGFSLAMLITMIYDFIKNKFKSVLNFIIMGTTVFPSIILVYYQQSTLFDEKSEMKFGYFAALEELTSQVRGHIYIYLLMSFLFAFIIAAVCFKEFFTDSCYVFSWVFLLVNMFFATFLYETGPRATHGNFLWAAYFAAGFILAVSIAKYDKLIKEEKITCMIVSSAVLGAQFFSWLNYMIELCNGRVPYR